MTLIQKIGDGASAEVITSSAGSVIKLFDNY